MRIGVEGTWLPNDQRGMGRYLRNILACWEGRADVVLLARRPAQVRWLQEAYPWAECRLFDDPPRLDVCWFPWNRVDVLTSCPRVLTLHDLAPFHRFSQGAAQLIDQERFRLAAARAEAVIAVTGSMRREILSRLALPPEKVTVIPEGIDPVFLEPEAPRAPLPAGPFILAVGTMEPRKNLGRLLEAFPEVHARTGHRLVVAGSLPRPGWALGQQLHRWLGRGDPVEERLRALGDRITLEHQPDDRRLAALYRSCAAYVFPTLYEGFGLPLLEALVSGAPVAASRIEPLTELGGDLPEWFDPGDPQDISRALIEVLRAPRRATPEALARLRETYSWPMVSARVLEHLHKVAGRPRAAR